VGLKEKGYINIRMHWNEIDLNLITVDNESISYNGGILKFQIPLGYTDIGVSEWSRLSIAISDSAEFFEWFKKLEEIIGKTEPYDSVISEEQNTISLKVVDGYTQFFDENKKYFMDTPSIVNSKVYAIMDIPKKYGPFKDRDRNGLVCRLYQVVFAPEKCGFSE
jgi:hypothetical protein